ncbi:hypothetical protein QN372_00900 [Undibacterium sp. RTI2.1]|uniref:hypothetical protein n=1 Tax=unclassified Undibacterium TaxID=2630295 RepID=UPI002AB3BF1B|nr:MULTISPECIES: hypothetical protein [unclassified Undibacterium]MDY7537695.1 hypothetical protein [Undibacterium sp. 5I1]MEB0029297.1 hypothetical protein [Undibacterium sp. RTI2.1]MEB0115605.1 hypothetical protein [Undibacterium sp. RTI2.2]MEB0256432.1 hypothetical protein [Undibacterium sp. 5I1]
MSIVIDRNQNVIVNQAGRAHITGWVAVGFHGIDDQVALAKGAGYQATKSNKTTHITQQSETPVWAGKSGDLTLELFKSVTGWTA